MVRIIYYDISVPKGRTKVHDYLEAQGFVRIQYSVFVGQVKATHWRRVWRQLTHLHETYCDPDDKLNSHLIEARHFREMCHLGNPIDIDWVLNEVGVFFI